MADAREPVRMDLDLGRPTRPALEECGIVAPAVRRYITDLEVSLAAVEARAWTVATELFYEADNRGSQEFSELADELLGVKVVE